MDLYQKVPQTVKDPSDPHKQKTQKQEAVTNFLTECLPSKRISAGAIDMLKGKYIILDSTRKKWKPTSKARCRNSLSARDRRKLKVFDIKKDGHKFEEYVPLHRLWQDYMRDILDIPRYASEVAGQKKENNERLLKADYHGCMIVVRKTRCPSLLGLAGIVLMETRNTFKVVTKENKIKCLPKMNTLFSFELDGYVFTIHGNQFCSKPTMRVRKKFKFKGPVDI
ncbi:ribonuclease P protein subunit p29-like [Mercenaria mercenaria]|uniref:ribonuclease P protein subunit p29-like n=1 Tax=Mercenaria mercenaria TaxID=6596 RepID=UPI00234E6E68|nr:ribonuclease P protein subunit p29-like [Mercenaria mercenaria]XP_045192956.2 ribonuclease P protein subunit p29-like [Mercenaria mercenaria]